MTYDTEDAKWICNESSPDGDDQLYQTDAGEFFLATCSTFVDGRQLKPWQGLEDVAPKMGPATCRDLKGACRMRCEHQLVSLTHCKALTWCIKTQMPECFRGVLLESIRT